MNKKYPIVIYGASGYTGRLIAEYLRDYGIPFIAAGRNRAKIEEAMKTVPGIENAVYEIVEVEHTVEALAELFNGRRVVCNTVGPFIRKASTVIEVFDMFVPGGIVLKGTAWGAIAHPVWFKNDPRVRNCKMIVALFNQAIYKRMLELGRVYKVSLQWVPEEELTPLLDRMAETIYLAGIGMIPFGIFEGLSVKNLSHKGALVGESVKFNRKGKSPIRVTIAFNLVFSSADIR